MKMARLKRFLPSLLMLAGVALLIYVAAQYGTMYAAQRRLAQEWQQQNVPLPAQPAGLVTTLTRLTVPSIKLDAVVVEGVDRKDLLMGPGHLTDTPEPGQRGNSVISGHRDTFFRPLKDLKIKDEIQFSTLNGDFRYVVESVVVVDPNNVGVLAPSSENLLTLVTCYPFFYIGAAPKRFIVRARQVPAQALARSTVE